MGVLLKNDQDILELNKHYLELKASKEYILGKRIYRVLELIRKLSWHTLLQEIKFFCKCKKYNSIANNVLKAPNYQDVDISHLKIAVYTVLLGHYDDIKEPVCVEDGIDYYIFTDIDVPNTSVWKKIDITAIPEYKEFGPYKLNRYLKMLPYDYLGMYDYSLYVDASVKIVGTISPLVKQMGNRGLGIHWHDCRECAYSEGYIKVAQGWADPMRVEEQLETYKREGFPHGYGLFENGVLLRQHRDNAVKELMFSWWQEYCKFPTRDQISLPYVMWKDDFARSRICVLGENVHLNPRFCFCEHKAAQGIRADK